MTNPSRKHTLVTPNIRGAMRDWFRVGLLLLLALVLATAGMQGPAPSPAGLAGQGPSGDQLPVEPAYLLHRTPLTDYGHHAHSTTGDGSAPDTEPALPANRLAGLLLPARSRLSPVTGDYSPARRSDPALAPILARAPPVDVLVSG